MPYIHFSNEKSNKAWILDADIKSSFQCAQLPLGRDCLELRRNPMSLDSVSIQMKPLAKLLRTKLHFFGFKKKIRLFFHWGGRDIFSEAT